MKSALLYLLFTPSVAVFGQPQPVFRASTQLIQVDVAAADRNGHPVTDLKKEDLELRVNGRERAMDNFTATSVVPVSSEPLPPGTFGNRQASGDVLQGRYTVFLLDWRNTNFALQSFAIQQLQKLMDEAPPYGNVAVYLITRDGLRIAQEFTSDHARLREKISELEGSVPPPANNPVQAEAAAQETVTAFRNIAKHLAGISGQKILIWISTGFPDSEPPDVVPEALAPIEIVREDPNTSFAADIDAAVHVLGNANIVVESAQAAYPGANVSPENGPVRSYVNPLQMIAERTGGRFFAGDSTDFTATLRSAANDREGGYEVGFYDDGTWKPGMVPVEIKSKRPGISLRYREGFYVDPVVPAPPAGLQEIAQDVFSRAVDAVKIPITARVTKTAGNRGTLSLRLNVDTRALTLRQDGNLWHTKPAFFTRFTSDDEDQVGDVPLDSPELTLTREQYDHAMKTGINLRFTVKSMEGARTLRVLVRDESSGDTGTVTIPVTDVPEAY